MRTPRISVRGSYQTDLEICGATTCGRTAANSTSRSLSRWFVLRSWGLKRSRGRADFYRPHDWHSMIDPNVGHPKSKVIRPNAARGSIHKKQIRATASAFSKAHPAMLVTAEHGRAVIAHQPATRTDGSIPSRVSYELPIPRWQ